MNFTTWRDVLQFGVTVVAGLIGVPITQAIKNWFKLEDKGAIVITAVIAGLLAVLEIWLSGQIDFNYINMKNFPEVFGLVFAVGTIYYHLMKDNRGVFGQKFMIKRSNL